LRGTPGELIGIMDMERAEAPDPAAFKVVTRDVAETAFGYHQRMRFAPLKSANLPRVAGRQMNLSFRSLPAPGTRGSVPISTSVDPHTPPGIYEAVFDVAGEERQVQIEVLPVEQLAISPRSISIVAPAGEVINEELILTNRGNVSLTLDILGMLVLQEEEQVCLSIQRALGQVKANPDGEAHKVFLDALATSLAEKKTDFGRVRLADGPIELGAGESRYATVAIHTPRDMIGGHQYRALLKARGAAQLFVKITCSAGGKSTA